MSGWTKEHQARAAEKSKGVRPGRARALDERQQEERFRRRREQDVEQMIELGIIERLDGVVSRQLIIDYISGASQLRYRGIGRQ